ncbi:MAG: hypothetical protein CSA49_01690 [Gammaproteobacteria bacterium]|nr:MAG: hypothetical protein CSA49_01690 [Gammaproteobacteria bacterium]
MKTLLIAGALLMASAVALGAFGAHGLKDKLALDMLQVYQTGVEYHFFHALGILLIGVIAGFYPNVSGVQWAGWLLIAGVLLFSGSLYVLALSGIKGLGAITPIGGMAFIIGWVTLAVSLYRQS